MFKGISTQLFLEEKLSIERLKAIQDEGYDCIEILAIPPHFDYRDKQLVAKLAAWLRDQDSFLASIHTPFSTDYQALKVRQWLSLSDPERLQRQKALDEIRLALEITEKVACPVAVVHAGAPGDRHGLKLLEALYQSLEVLIPFAEARGVKIVLENIPNDLSRLDNLVRFLEDADLPSVGICFDTGHSNLQANLCDEINIGGPWITAVHLHDNLGKRDEHLLPFEGTIHWEEVLQAFEKIQYSGSWMLEVKAGEHDPRKLLGSARQVFDQFELIIEQTRAKRQGALTSSS